MLLAKTFLRADVDRFLDELTPEQFDEWLALYQLDPWGEQRADLRIANLALAVESMLAHFGRDPRLRAQDLMPYTDFPDEAEDLANPDTWEDAALQQEKLRIWLASNGG